MKAALPPLRDGLALASLFASSAFALFMVPRSAWGQLHDPSVRAALLMLVVLVCIVVLRRGGASGARRERLLLCVFLAGMPLVYLESGVRKEAGAWLVLESVGLLVFAGWAWLTHRR